ncbi:MAG TPA: alpha/beta hydrolase [Spirochaetota bacterium]|nr:alpha/beta hydrolase [Spirochaetota bacterium]HOD15405.1 alpha/beta hydrolase [Spirochaetota bacterium]HPG50654.1 alpha/beta hydrolase [Spirochaetota bacterium]HPN11449.1 alpha/beta hydrolase [Spirochaetota bacterium]HQL80721.1 alpha/beta hydrolase [Spirochaetota bacterium]
MIRNTMIKLIVRTLANRLNIAKQYKSVNRAGDMFAGMFLRVPKTCEISFVDAGGVPGEWIGHAGPDSGRRIFFIHGGGYVLFSTKIYRDLIYRIARASDARVLAVNYRLAPEHPHPAAVDDVMAAYRRLLETGVKPSRVAVMGDSAGGGLTLVLLQKLRDKKLPLPACAVCLSPWTDLTLSGAAHRENRVRDPMMRKNILHDCIAHYVGTSKPSIPAISPLFGKFSQLPPLLFQVGTEEVLLDDSRMAAERAANAGTIAELQVWPGMIHDFQMWAKVLPDSRRAIRAIGHFVKQHIQ